MTETIRDLDSWFRIIDAQGNIVFDVIHYATQRAWGWACHQITLINDEYNVTGIADNDAELFEIAYAHKCPGDKISGYLKPEYIAWTRGEK